MAIHIRKARTDALARKVAASKGTSLTEAVHISLAHELERQEANASLLERTRAFVRTLHAQRDPSKGLPAGKDFIDSLYED